MNSLTRYWISWRQPENEPLPLLDAAGVVLSTWKSGRVQDGAETMWALADAERPDLLERALDDYEVRFIEACQGAGPLEFR